MMEKIKIGTRKSVLAMVQTRIVAEKIRSRLPGIEIEIVPIITEGDKRLDKNLSSFSGKGIFTKELEKALLNGNIHMAVHSAKDMPVEFPEGLTMGAVVERAEVEDMIVTLNGCPLSEMEPGTRIGTGSLRRKLQIENVRPGIMAKDIRGNVQTRLKKLEDGHYDAVVLARAGIERLLRDRDVPDKDFYKKFHYEILDENICLPAAGQAILAVEVAEKELEKPDFVRLCGILNDREAALMLSAERSFLEVIGGGCHAPAAVCSRIDNRRITLKGGFAEDGRSMRFASVSGMALEAAALGRQLGGELLNNQ